MSDDASTLGLAQRLLPPLVDLTSLAGAVFLVPWLGTRLFTDAGVAYAFLIPGFVVMVAGILAIRNLPNYALDDRKGLSLFGMCLIFFQLVTYSLLFAYATHPGASESSNDGLAVVLFFALLLPVLGAFVLPARNAEPNTRKALITETVGLLSVNYLTIIGAAVWYYFTSLPTGDDPVYATGFSFLVLYVLLFLLFLAFFGLPRLYLLRATGDGIGLGIYLVSLAVYLWNHVPPVN